MGTTSISPSGRFASAACRRARSRCRSRRPQCSRALSPTPGAPLFARHGTARPTLEDLTSDLLCAAHDAGVENPAEVTPAALRHTYLAFLARQGIRLADLVRLVGRLPPEQIAVYGSYAPPGERLALDEVNRVIDGIGKHGAS